MSHAPVRNRTLAALLALLVAIGGGLVATQSAAADPAPVVTLSPTGELDPAAENTITVSGTGFTGAGAANGVYVLLGPAANWAEGTPLPSSGWIAQAWVPSIIDGAFSTTVTAPAGSMDAAGSYVVATSAAHGLSQTDRSLDTRTSLTLIQPEPDPEPEPEPEPEPTPDPVAGITVSPTTDLADGATVTITGSFPATVDVAGTPKSTTLYAMYCVDPGDARATGTQCDSTRQKLLSPVALYGGSVPATGTVADGWWTFETTMTVPAAFGDHECLTDGDEQCGVFIRLDHTFPGNVSLDSFTPVTFAATPVVPTITVSKTTGLNPAGETITITGTGFSPNPPATTGTRPPLSGQFGGAYVVFGKFPDTWKPSDGVASSARKIGAQKWVVNPENVSLLGAQGVAINPDGSFTLELTVAPGYANEPATGNYGIYTYPGSGAAHPAFETYTPISFADPTPVEPAATNITLAAAPLGGATVGQTVTITATVSPEVAGTVTFRAGSVVLGARRVTEDAATASVSYTPSAAGAVTLSAEFTPADEDAFASSTASRDYTITAPTVAQGSLTWGVKASFRSYVTGGIAQGSIATSGVGYSGGEFLFGQATGGTYSASTGTGTSNYNGSVRFTGHGGQLDLTLSNPIVRVDSPTSGVLLVSIDGGPHVPFASLALGSGSYSTPGNAVAWSGVPASLTAQGASAFSLDGAQFYPAGTALDPVSFVIGSPSSGGGSSIVSAYGGERQPASTPPATTGLAVAAPDAVVAGGQITVTGSGFEPNEQGILVVIYSDPVVLSRTLTADASGVATWTGRLPAGLTGTHTLTFQGSTDLGVVLDIPAKVAIAAGGCPVIDADLSWGFKESFRAYISGSIANGEWTVADGATYETPLFGWSGGEGSYDPETAEGLVSFLGAITFTGHGGILNTTVSNPQLQFVDASTAILLLDVSGTTQEGEPVDERGVPFVELDLSDAVSRDGDVLTITEAPAVLLADGAAAFGTYETDEPFDAISAHVELDSTCADAPVVEEPVDEEPLASTSGLPWWGWLAIALVIVAIAVAITVLLLRRRRA